MVCTATPAPDRADALQQRRRTALDPPHRHGDFGSTFKNLALFGQGTLNVSDRFRLIGGLRYTHRPARRVPQPRHDARRRRASTNFDQVSSTGSGASRTAPFTAKTTNDNLSGKARRPVRPRAAIDRYATYSRGYKGPAYNVFFNLTATGTNVIAPETVGQLSRSGLKNTLFDGKLVAQPRGLSTPSTTTSRRTTPTSSRASWSPASPTPARSRPAACELDLIFRPCRDLSISGGVAYTDAKSTSSRCRQRRRRRGDPSGTPTRLRAEVEGLARRRLSLSAPAVRSTSCSARRARTSRADLAARSSADAVRSGDGRSRATAWSISARASPRSDDRYRLTFQVQEPVRHRASPRRSPAAARAAPTATRSRAMPIATTA